MNLRNNILFLIILSSIAVPGFAKIKIGIMAGESISNIPTSKKKEDVNIPPIADPELHKFKYNGNGLIGGAFLGIEEAYGSYRNTYQASVYYDQFKAKNNKPKLDILSGGGEDNTQESIKRKYTFELAVKVGRIISDDLEASLKIGGLYSKFEQKFLEIGINQSGISNKTAWGTVFGIGIEKAFNHFNAGLAYDYHYYPFFKNNVRWGSFNNTYKLKPRYHNIYLTIGKTL